MIILVCGGRDFSGKNLLYSHLDRFLDDNPFIVQGGARGADRFAAAWANERGVPCAEVKANWDRFGKSAGHIRNSWMLDLSPDLVIAFEGGKGTEGMVKASIKRGIPTETIGWSLDD